MRIVPAVDIRGGLCVNLVQGDYAQETVFSDDPVAQAVEWHRQCQGIVHIVDLDGAKAGRVCCLPQLEAMRDAGVPFEVGGGIRSHEAIDQIVAAGADRVILGTAAHEQPDLVRDAAKKHPGRIAVGIDAKAGKVALSGWLEVTETDAIAFARDMEAAGAARIIYTDILSDGMMKGPNLETTRAIAAAVGIPVTASGGVSSLDDIKRLQRLEENGVDEVIVGRALYLNAFTIAEAHALLQPA